MNRIIGVTGRAGSGKDTVYQILKTEFPSQQVNRLAFADLLKESAMASLNLRMPLVDEFKEHGVLEIRFGGSTTRTLSGREFLQRYGAEAHRDIFGTDFWVDAALERLSDGVTVITDVRYDNEAQAIHEMGGVVWQLERPGDSIEESDHSSEHPVDPMYIENTIVNDGSKTELRKKILWAWGEQPQSFMEVSKIEPKRPATVPLFEDSLAHQLELFQDERDLYHSYLKRKEIAERTGKTVAEITDELNA